MRTATVRPMRVLDASGRPWRPTMDQYLRVAGESPFKGASYGRRAGALWNPSGGSADADHLPQQDDLRRRSREQARNNPLAAGALLSLLSNVIGDGLQARPLINKRVLGLTHEQAAEKQQEILQIWNPFAESTECDLTRQSNLYGLQALAYLSAKESGDCLTLLPAFTRPGSIFETRVQIVEADRVQNPLGYYDTDRMAGGVELDSNGASLAYHVLTRHPGDAFGYRANSKRIAAYGQSTGRRVSWLLYQKKRPGQNRGLPYFTPVLEHFKQLERYTDAELHASVVGGSFTVFVKSPSGEGLGPMANAGLTSTTTVPVASVPMSTATDIALDYGAIVDLAPGEDIELADPKRPNQAFGDFVESVIKQVAAGLGLPFELLIRHFRNSYSASRAALLEAWKFFRMERAWFAQHWLAPIYEAVLTEAVLRDFIDLPGFLEDLRLRAAWLGVTWLGPAPGQINPTVEVEAAEKRITIGVSTIAREAAEISGEDWEDVHQQRVEEVSRRRRDGLEPVVKPPKVEHGVLVDPDRMDAEEDTDNE